MAPILATLGAVVLAAWALITLYALIHVLRARRRARAERHQPGRSPDWVRRR